MLYELIAVVRPGSVSEVREIAKTTATQILRSSGVIRSITNWGPFLLPRPTTKHQTQHHLGHYFILRFDASAATQAEVRRNLGNDPRMIRFGCVKLAERLGGNRGPAGYRLGRLEDIGSEMEWLSDRAEKGHLAPIDAFVRKQGQKRPTYNNEMPQEISQGAQTMHQSVLDAFKGKDFSPS